MDRNQARKIATIALHRAMEDDLATAASYVKRLSHTDGLIVAVIGWIDTFLNRLHPDHKYGDPLRIAWLNVPTGHIETADEVSPSMQWAGRLIGARAADDEELFYFLLRAPAEGAQLGDGIMALLHIVATSLSNQDKVRAAGATA